MLRGLTVSESAGYYHKSTNYTAPKRMWPNVVWLHPLQRPELADETGSISRAGKIVREMRSVKSSQRVQHGPKLRLKLQPASKVTRRHSLCVCVCVLALYLRPAGRGCSHDSKQWLRDDSGSPAVCLSSLRPTPRQRRAKSPLLAAAVSLISLSGPADLVSSSCINDIMEVMRGG